MSYTISLSMFYTGFKRVSTWWNYKNIISPFYRLYYIEDGYGRVYIDGIPYELVPNTLFLIPKFTLHSYECDDYMDHYYICFFDDLVSSSINNLSLEFKVIPEVSDLDLIKRYTQVNPNKSILNSAPQYYDNSRSLYTSRNEKSFNNLAHQIESQGILLQLFSRFITNKPHKRTLINNSYEKLDDIVFYINTNLNKRITVLELANMMHLSADHFSKTFKKVLGLLPNEYIQVKRIEKAQFLLLTTEMNILEIAEEVGIVHPSQFTRLFKKITKCLPKDYRTRQLEF